MKATWEEFDKEPGYWVKPTAHTKQRKVHKLPLSPAAIELVHQLRQKRKGQWVFPGDKPRSHLTVLSRVWEFVRKETGLGKDARIYDLRHSYASIGAGGGLSLLVIGKLLGHSQPRTTTRYAHLGDDPLKEAANKIGDAIVGAGKPGAPVTPLHGRRP
jgi:integrase